VHVWLDTLWSRLDQGYGVEALHKMDPVRTDLAVGQPIRMEVVERCLEGENKGLLRTGSPPKSPFLSLSFLASFAFSGRGTDFWSGHHAV
jgi:hypothetical protein